MKLRLFQRSRTKTAQAQVRGQVPYARDAQAATRAACGREVGGGSVIASLGAALGA